MTGNSTKYCSKHGQWLPEDIPVCQGKTSYPNDCLKDETLMAFRNFQYHFPPIAALNCEYHHKLILKNHF